MAKVSQKYATRDGFCCTGKLETQVEKKVANVMSKVKSIFLILLYDCCP